MLQDKASAHQVVPQVCIDPCVGEQVWRLNDAAILARTVYRGHEITLFPYGNKQEKAEAEPYLWGRGTRPRLGGIRSMRCRRCQDL